MCWAYKAAESGIKGANVETQAPHVGRITRAGQSAAMLADHRGTLGWIPTRYGMTIQIPASKLVWNARDDKLSTTEPWTRLVRQRCVVPIEAYVESKPAETWFIGPVAYLVGYFDRSTSGGWVAITEADGAGRRPVLVDEAAARAWLSAEQYEVEGLVGAMTRVGYAEADLFQAKALSADARTRVPLARAA